MDGADIYHDQPLIFRERSDEIRFVWCWLVRNNRVKGEYFTLNRAILENTVRHYANDLEILKIRYAIGDSVRSQKIAGLAAGAILRFRPAVPIDGACYAECVKKDSPNETLAVFHGVSVCADHYIRNYGASYDSLSAFLKTPRYEDWVNKNVYLLKERNYTSEALVMVFEGFCLANFPEAVEKELKDINNS